MKRQISYEEEELKDNLRLMQALATKMLATDIPALIVALDKTEGVEVALEHAPNQFKALIQTADSLRNKIAHFGFNRYDDWYDLDRVMEQVNKIKQKRNGVRTE